MGSFALLVFSAILINFLHRGTALRCRVSNHQTDDQFKKILHVCRQRNSGRDVEDDERSSDDSDDSENSSTSIEDVFDKRLFLNNNNNNNRYASTSPYGDWYNDRNSQPSNDRNDRSRQYNRTYGYSGNMQDHNMGNYRGSASQGNRRRMGNTDTYNNNYNNHGQEQACTIQCFFNELNVVDHRGFPERRALTNLMTQNVQDPELKDFIEESIIECFHYLDSSPHKEKCRFSQTFLACLAEKGKERCEDWE